MSADIIVYSEGECVKTIKGRITSEDEFFVKIRDDYGNDFSIAKKLILKIKQSGGNNNET